MPDILLFGASGFTGRLTTQALARRGADFAIAGRDEDKLRRLAATAGDPEVHLCEVGDPRSLVRALEGFKVLITCVGPFVDLGWTAVEAAIEAGVHYVDSTGETSFVHRVVERFGDRARDAGVTMVPAMGFDEVPSDLAVSLASEGLERPDVTITYAVPTTASRGTVRSALGIISSGGWRVAEGLLVETRMAERSRWAPFPPPLGVRRALSAPLCIGRVAPMHLDMRNLDVFMTTGELQRAAMTLGTPVLRLALGSRAGQRTRDLVVRLLPEGPRADTRRKRWTVLAEARTSGAWRNVIVTGEDVYGLTASFLAGGAQMLAEDKGTGVGVLAPVEAFGLPALKELAAELGVRFEIFGSVGSREEAHGG